MKKILVIASMMLLGSSGTWAAMTAPDTDISNDATLTYTVGAGATPQTPITSNTDTFKVDRKIDIVVANTNTNKAVDVEPGTSDRELRFTIANQGNDQETYALTYADIAAGDQFDPTSCQIDVGAGFQNFPQNITIAAETNASVVVQCDIPAAAPAVGGVNDDDNGTIVLTATVQGRGDDTAAVDDQHVVQDILADGAGETDNVNSGDHSDRGTYHVATATLSVVKSSTIISDPLGNATPHRIPGAIIRYCFVVDNNGSAAAADVKITDDFTAGNKTNLTVVKAGYTVQANTVACDCTLDGSDAGVAAGATNIEITVDPLNAGQRECAYIEAEIN
jgi:hypothetical protein